MRGIVTAAAAAAMLASCGGAGSDAANEATAEGSAAGNGSQGNASLPVTDRRPPTPPTAENAQQYVALVAASDLFEIETARVALERRRGRKCASSPE